MLKEEAIAGLFRDFNEKHKIKTDVIIEPVFFIETVNKVITVTVWGYSGTYSNFTEVDDDVNLIEITNKPAPAPVSPVGIRLGK